MFMKFVKTGAAAELLRPDPLQEPSSSTSRSGREFVAHAFGVDPERPNTPPNDQNNPINVDLEGSVSLFPLLHCS
jgi:hypothetical protein